MSSAPVGAVTKIAARAWFRGALVYLVALAIQQSVLADVRIGGAAADIMLGLAIAAGLVTRDHRGVVAAFCLGLLYDLVLHTPFGLSALAYTLVAWMAAAAGDRLLRNLWWFTMLVGAVGSAVGVLLYATIGSLMGLSEVFTLHLATVVAVVAIVNGLLMPVHLRVQRWVLATVAIV